MIIRNGSAHEIAVGSTLKGPLPHKAMMMKPGETLDIANVLHNVRVDFATTPDGLRVAIYEEGLILPGNIHLN